MKTSILLFFTVVAASSLQAAVLQVNLGPSGLPAETGFTAWTTGDNSAPAATTIGGIGLSLTVQSSDAGGGTGVRSIDRGGNDAYAGSLADLTQSWWGVRAGNTTPGGQFTIIVNGADLGAGSFDWTSWHHDHEDQTGLMDIEYSVDGGSNFSLGLVDFDIVAGEGGENHAGAPNPATLSFTSNGTDDIHVRFTNVSVSPGNSEPFALINGFQIDEVPEPSAAALIGLGALGLLTRRRR